jgi:hypothetical protein
MPLWRRSAAGGNPRGSLQGFVDLVGEQRLSASGMSLLQ